MPELVRAAAIGEADLLLPLRALGVRVVPAASVEEARTALRLVAAEGYGLCFVQEEWLEALAAERAELSRRGGLTVVGFPDFRSGGARLDAELRALAVAATGSDSLIERKA